MIGYDDLLLSGRVKRDILLVAMPSVYENHVRHSPDEFAGVTEALCNIFVAPDMRHWIVDREGDPAAPPRHCNDPCACQGTKEARGLLNVDHRWSEFHKADQSTDRPERGGKSAGLLRRNSVRPAYRGR